LKVVCLHRLLRGFKRRADRLADLVGVVRGDRRGRGDRHRRGRSCGKKRGGERSANETLIHRIPHAYMRGRFGTASPHCVD